MQTLIEGDFFGSSGTETLSNSHNPRLRHAYIQVGGLTAGQTWSTFTSYVLPDTIEDATNYNYIRQPQVRWSHDINSWGYDIALENPETTLTDTSSGTVGPGDDRLPDLVGRLRFYQDWGEASASVLLRQIRQDRTLLSDGVTQRTNDDEAFGWGFGASARINMFGKDDLRLSVIAGEGVGRYMANDAFNAGSIDNQGQIDLIESWGGFAAYRHWWNDGWRSSFTYSWAEADNNTAVTGTAVNESSQSFIANLYWTPIPSSLIGWEYGYIERELEDGQSGDMSLLLLRLLYNF